MEADRTACPAFLVRENLIAGLRHSISVVATNYSLDL